MRNSIRRSLILAAVVCPWVAVVDAEGYEVFPVYSNGNIDVLATNSSGNFERTRVQGPIIPEPLILIGTFPGANSSTVTATGSLSGGTTPTSTSIEKSGSLSFMGDINPNDDVLRGVASLELGASVQHYLEVAVDKILIASGGYVRGTVAPGDEVSFY